MSRPPGKLAAALAAAAAFVGSLAGASSEAADLLRRALPTEALRVKNVSPPCPLVGKEFELLIFGQGFSEDQEKVEVRVGDLKAQEILVQSPTRIKALFPAVAKPGWAAVTVVNPDKTSSTLGGAVYFRAPGGGFNWDVLIVGMRYDWRGFVEWFVLGGPVMYPIAILSFIGVAWGVHCLLVVRRSQVLPQRFMEALSSYLVQGDLRGATATCEKTRCVFGRVVLAGLRKLGERPEIIREAIEAAGTRESAHLHQKISYLANIGVIEPMLGLLGTVLGMILAFNVISSGDVRHYLLAAALAQAMITTAAGLLVGIPAMAVYFYLRGRLLRLTTHLEVVADEVAQTIVEKGEEA